MSTPERTVVCTIDPSTGKAIQNYKLLAKSEVEHLLAASQQAYLQWKSEPFKTRSSLLLRLRDLLLSKKDHYATLMALEMGKPIIQGIREVEKSAWVCEYYAQNAEHFLKTETVDSPTFDRSYVVYQPLGPIFCIMPWNFPFWQVIRFAAPALMAGNSVLLKHSENTFGCGAAIETLFREAGFPPGVFQNLFIDHDTAAFVIQSGAVRAVTLTGSSRAGRAVASLAGASLKKCVLELGGSDPYIVLGDADLDRAAETCVNSRLINSGQSCVAAKRFIVVESVYRAFIDRFVSLMQTKSMGPATSSETDVGPLARHDLRKIVHEQTQNSISCGARCLMGGSLPERDGFFYPPTVLIDVTPGMPAFDQELFGPVASIIAAKDETQAIALANQSEYGLGAAVFSADIDRAVSLARDEIEAGLCAVNTLVQSDPHLPFGGIKNSGFGRELSQAGIREFVNVKSIMVRR